jgi:predicted phosphodiesterase
MKIAVLADIHGNEVALQAVAAHVATWRPDRVIVAGDVVNRGPRSLACLDFVLAKQQQEGWLLVRGNHEDYVLQQAQPTAPRSGPLFAMQQSSFQIWRQLNGDLAALAAMPFHVSVTGPDGRELRVIHASMKNNRTGIYPDTPDESLRQMIAPPPGVLCVGHTHRPLIRRLDDTLVVNAGSVGLPFDGDRRAAYARLSYGHGRWQARIVRLAYDWELGEQAYFTDGFLENDPLAQLVLLEFRQARPLLGHWFRQYEQRVLDGEISLAEAVTLMRDA